MIKKFFISFFIFLSTVVFARDPQKTDFAKVKETYNELRNMNLNSTRIINIDQSIVITRDIADLTFLKGSMYFFEPVDERITGLYFDGEGIITLYTDDRIEQQQLMRFTGSEYGDIYFEQALIFFTDSTYEEIIDICEPVTHNKDDWLVKDVAGFRDELRDLFLENTDARILCDLTGDKYGTYFSAFLECKHERLWFSIDRFIQEPVILLRYEKKRLLGWADFDTWYSAGANDDPEAMQAYCDIEKVDLNIHIDKKEVLTGTAQIHFKNHGSELHCMPMELAPQLRVSEVLYGKNDTCFFIQEDKEKDGELWVYLPWSFKSGETNTLTVNYSGEDVVDDIGGGNYVVSYRASWYPTFSSKYCDPAHFRIKYCVPGNTLLLSTGELKRSWDEDGFSCSEWESTGDYQFAGFNYGDFAYITEEDDKCRIDCYTNKYLSTAFAELRKLLEQSLDLQAALMILPQELTIDRMGRNAIIESQNAYGIYVHFFGKIPFHDIKISQQPHASFGQSWPGFIYLPFTAFMDQSITDRYIEVTRGFAEVRSYESFREGVAAHEIAHQWWGHTVMIDSYRDQWLEEGFATYSEALCLQLTQGTNEFKNFMKEAQEYILRKGELGIRFTDLGPISIGYRLSSLINPHGSDLIYSKGAYVLHMLRMMLFNFNNKSDDNFIAMMKDFVRQYKGKIATTADFQRIVEKHFGCDMSWFFDQWVYGTAVPKYWVEYTTDRDPGGGYILTVNVQQENVPGDFQMPLPILVNFDEGYAVVSVMVSGHDLITKQFKLPMEPRSIEVNPWYAVLCEID
jgi:hypothetical protein